MVLEAVLKVAAPLLATRAPEFLREWSFSSCFSVTCGMLIWFTVAAGSYWCDCKAFEVEAPFS